jgi:hypothetical protein
MVVHKQAVEAQRATRDRMRWREAVVSGPPQPIVGPRAPRQWLQTRGRVGGLANNL